MQVYVLPGLQRLEEARLLSLTLWACKAQAAVLEMSTLRGQVHTVLQAAVQGMVPAVQLQTQGKDAGEASSLELRRWRCMRLQLCCRPVHCFGQADLRSD